MLAQNQYVLAVDIGGTKLEAAIVDTAGRIVDGSRQRRATGSSLSRDEITRNLEDAVRASLARAPGEVAAAGIGSAGPIDLADGTTSPHNLPALRRYPVLSVVETAAAVPGILRLDGTCIALAEHWQGATQGARASMSLVVSTGVGGGIIVEGKTVGGSTGNAGHLGQILISSGISGDSAESNTLEALASGPSTVRWANAHGWQGTTGEDLAASVRLGDAVALEATRRSAAFVGQAIASATTLLDLDAVAIGGGFVHVREDYLDIVRASVHQNAIFEYARRVRIDASGLGGAGPLLGAAGLWLAAEAVTTDAPLPHAFCLRGRADEAHPRRRER